MRILWVTNTLMPPIARHLGVEGSASGSWMVDIARQLSDDASVELGVACVHGREYSTAELNRTKYYMLPGTGRNMMFYTRSFEDLWDRVVEDFNPEIVHLHGTEYSHGLSLLRRHANLKAVVSIQGLLERIQDVDYGGLSGAEVLLHRTWRENTHLNGMIELHWLHKRNARYEAEILRSVGYANCVNAWDRSVVLSINPSLKCYQLEYNLREEFYSAQKWSIEGADRHTIFTNPGGVPLKGLHILIRAIAIVRQSYPDVRLVVPGMGDGSGRLAATSGYAKYIRALLRQLELTDCVEFLGRQTGDQMMSRMRRAHVVVVPSAIEGTSLVLRESMFLGVPCVASFRGGMADFISDKRDGFLYDYQEYPYLAQRVMELFENDELCREFSERAIVKAEAAHDRAVNVRAYLQMYRDIMSDTGVASSGGIRG